MNPGQETWRRRSDCDDPNGTATSSLWRPRRRGILSYVWPLLSLIFLAPSVAELLQADRPPLDLAVNLGALALFGALWGWLIIRSPGAPRTRRFWAEFVLLGVLAAYFTVTSAGYAVGLFVYLGVLGGFTSPVRSGVATFGTVAVVAAILGWVVQAPFSLIGEFVLMIVLLSGSACFTRALLETTLKLQAARAEITRLAVSEERVRFARDLHDLLGHSLSAMALKTELARRLIYDDPARAEREIGEVETLVREALREVREAVAGYRQPTVADELERGQEILAAARIDYVVEGSPGALAPPLEAVLAWTVREGITNVVRHSRATCCAIRWLREEDALGIEILDDGPGEGAPTESRGAGLSGLAERVERHGGRLAAGPRPDGGFRLRVILPRKGSAATDATRLQKVVSR